MTTNGLWPCDTLSRHAEVRGFREPFAFELWMNPSWRFWWKRNWTICFWISALYVAAVLLGQRLMRHRPALHLRRPLLAWNLFVTAYSLLAGVRVATEIAVHTGRDGFLASICDFGPLGHQQVLGTYVCLFALSKVTELGDTAFLVLRRKPVPFVHCFHHAFVLVLAWSSLGYPSPVSVYFMVMNQAMHILTYARLSLKTLRVRLPPAVVPLLAALELAQVVVGLGLTLYAARVKRSGASCCLYDETVNMLCVGYLAFTVVFAKVVVDAVRSRKGAGKAKSA